MRNETIIIDRETYLFMIRNEAPPIFPNVFKKKLNQPSPRVLSFILNNSKSNRKILIIRISPNKNQQYPPYLFFRLHPSNPINGIHVLFKAFFVQLKHMEHLSNLGFKPDPKQSMFNFKLFPSETLLNLAPYDHKKLNFLLESPSTFFLENCLDLKALQLVISFANLGLTSDTASFNFIFLLFIKLSIITFATQTALEQCLHLCICETMSSPYMLWFLKLCCTYNVVTMLLVFTKNPTPI